MDSGIEAEEEDKYASGQGWWQRRASVSPTGREGKADKPQASQQDQAATSRQQYQESAPAAAAAGDRVAAKLGSGKALRKEEDARHQERSSFTSQGAHDVASKHWGDEVPD